MENYLSTLKKKSASSWRRGITLFAEFYGKDIDAILEERKDDLTPRKNENLVDKKNRADKFERELEKFHKHLLDKGYSINSARTYCSGILQLFRYYSMGITLRNSSPISQTKIATGDFNLKPIHVRAIFHSAKDLRSKLLISLGNDLGWGASDIIELRKDELPNLDEESPIYFERIRGKTQQIARTCLSETTVKLLKEYLFTFPKADNPYLFASNGNHISAETINMRLKDLAMDSGINLGNKSLHWHLFRKMLISQAKNLSLDPDIIKLMTGKSVNKSMLPYLNDVNVKEAFKKLQKVTSINGILIKPEAGTKINELEEAIKQLEMQNFASKTRIDLLQKRTEKQQKDLDELEQKSKEYRDRMLELEGSIPPLNELMKLKKMLYSKKNNQS